VLGRLPTHPGTAMPSEPRRAGAGEPDSPPTQMIAVRICGRFAPSEIVRVVADTRELETGEEDHPWKRIQREPNREFVG